MKQQQQLVALAALAQAVVGLSAYDYNNPGAQVRFWVNNGDEDFGDGVVTQMPFLTGAGFATLPIIDCFGDDDSEASRYDIAILGAPHDTVRLPLYKLSPSHASRFPCFNEKCVAHRFFYRRQPAVLAPDLDLLPFGWAATKRPMDSVYTPVRIILLKNRLHSCCNHSQQCVERDAMKDWATIVDCGDAKMTWLDNRFALKTLEKAHKKVSGRPAKSSNTSSVPRIITLGGDHTTTLAALRATEKHWGPVSVIHFDSHVDTWDPMQLGKTFVSSSPL